MSKIKSVSTYDGNSWRDPVPLGANIENIDITNKVQSGTDETGINLNDSDLIIKNGDTGATALTKINKLKQRLVNILNPSSKESLVYDSGWQLASLVTSNFHNYGNEDSSDPLRYKRIGSIIYLQGVIQPSQTLQPLVDPNNPGGAVQTHTITTLPNDFRPSHTCGFVCQGSRNRRWYLTINTNGSCTFSRYADHTGYVNADTAQYLPICASFPID